MDAGKLQQLAEQYPDVRELLRDNYSLSVAAMAAQMETWRCRMDSKLETFDSNHARAQALIIDRMAALEDKLDRLVDRLAKRFKEDGKQSEGKTDG